MRVLLAAAVLAGTIAALTTTANAAGGCGPGRHRGPYSGCVVDRGPVIVAPVVVERPVVVVPRGRVCPYGFVWRYGRCRPI